MPTRELSAKSVKQPWSESKRAFHRQACRNKEKLSLGQKLEIVHRAFAKSDSEAFRTQAQLAVMFKKSRSAISKMLRPGNVQKLRQVVATGMHLDVKRHSWRDSSVQFLELERRVHQFVLASATEEKGSLCSASVCQRAEELAREVGVKNFKSSYGWFTRFMRRHGLSGMKDKTSTLASAHSEASEPVASVPAVDVSSSGSGDSQSCSASVDSSASTLQEAVQGAWGDGEHQEYGSMIPASPFDFPAQFSDVCTHAFATPTATAHGYHACGFSARRTDRDGGLDTALEGWQRRCGVYHRMTTHVKVSLQTLMGKVQRRLQISFPIDESCGRVCGFDILYSIVLSAFHYDLESVGCTEMPRLSYFDEEGDPIAISNDYDLGMAFQWAMSSPSTSVFGTTLRLHLNVF